MYKGNIPQMLDLIQPIEELIDKENLTDNERDSLTGELHMLKAYGRYNFNIDMEACLYHSREAIRLIKEENSYALGLAWVFYGGAMQTMRKSEEAKKAIYLELTRHSPGNLKANLYLILCYIDWLEGHLDQLCKTASQLELLGEELNSKEILANAKYFKGIGHYFLNEIKEAEKELEVATNYQPFTLLVHGFFALAALAYTKNELDDFNYAEKLLKELDKLAINRGGPHYVDFSRSITAELEWKQKKSADALKWATEKDFKPYIPMSNFLSGPLAQIKILATDTNKSSWQLAYDNAVEVIEFLRQTNNSNFLIRTLILQALVEYKLEQKIKASITFREAIEMASKRNFIQPFIHLKEELAPLFLELDEVTIPEDFLSLISPDDSAPETILTNREIEILHNMSENLSNKELGNRLFISESTVKRHIANIFKKLSAKNRREALAKARELKVV
jgi:DNA-binding CsgD family transcriptional regulator